MKTILLLVTSNIFMTLVVFVLFAALVLKEKLPWNYAVSFDLTVLAGWFATAFKPASAAPSGH